MTPRPKVKIKSYYESLRKKVFSDERIPAILGKPNSDVVVSRPGYVFATLYNGQTIEVINRVVPTNLPHLKVWLGYDAKFPNMFQVLSERFVFQDPVTTTLPIHGPEHAWPNGKDWTYFHGNQFLPLLAIPSTTDGPFCVKLYGAVVLWIDGSQYVTISTRIVDVSASVPTNGARYVLLNIDSSDVLTVKEGTEKDSVDFLTLADIPLPDENCIGPWAIKLYSGQEMTHKDGQWDDYIDLRWGRGGGESGTGDVIQDGSITAGHMAVFASDKHIEDGGVPFDLLDTIETSPEIGPIASGNEAFVVEDDLGALLRVTLYELSGLLRQLGNYVTSLISINTTSPLVGGGNLSTSRTISIPAATASTDGYMTSAQASKLDGIAEGAEVNVNADWDAVSGDAQILNKPTIPTQYTDEMAQDAVGSMAGTSLVYLDATPLLARAALTGDVTAPQDSNTTTIANGAVTNAKMANMAQATIKGRASGAGTGDPVDLTADQTLAILQGGSTPLGLSKYAFQARLTLTSGTPYPTASVVQGTTLYLTPLPYGDVITLYTSGAWKEYTLTEISLTLTSLPTASITYDIFVYDNGGTLTLEAVAWASKNVRAAALAKQGVILVKSGAADRRYVGTVYIDSAKKATDIIGGTVNSTTPTRKHVWNYYNRVLTSAKKTNFADGHTYNSPTYRKWNNTTTMDCEIVIGVAEKPCTVFAGGNQKDGASIDVMTNWTSGGGWLVDLYNASASQISAFTGGSIATTDIGLITLSVIEASPNSTTATFSTCVMDVVYEY